MKFNNSLISNKLIFNSKVKQTVVGLEKLAVGRVEVVQIEVVFPAQTRIPSTSSATQFAEACRPGADVGQVQKFRRRDSLQNNESF